MKKNYKTVKLIIISILAVVMLIVLIQNVSIVDVQFLFWTFTISRYLMLLLVFVTGFIVGWLLHSHFLRRKDKLTEE